MKTIYFVLVFFLLSTFLAATIINVPGDQPTIQAGINVAVDADTVLVQPGTYVENINYNGKLITVGSLCLTTHDTTYISQTIIDGNQSGSVVTFDSGEDSTAVLCGFTITGGSGTGPSPSKGGGIYCQSSSPSLVNVTITGNSATHGGGISCFESSPILQNVTIINNSAIPFILSGNGGGIACSYSSPSLLNVTITGNSAGGWGGCGGGISCFESSPSLENVIIAGNSVSASGGGIFCWVNSSPSLINVTLSDNTANNNGGGIYCDESNPSLVNVTISDNSVGYNGGGIYCDESNPSLVNVTITGNSAIYGSGGGIHCSSNSSPSLENVIIAGNSVSASGGGIYCSNSSISFSVDNRCSIYSNTIGNTRGFGADIYAEECDVIDISVDTFTVMTPTDYYASPIENFTFDIIHCIVDSLINADVYVSVDGDNSNSGISSDLPFKTINHALSRIYSDSLNINTIHLAPGIYSNSTNGEVFPIHWSNYVNLSGNNEDETILDAGNTSRVMDFYVVTDAIISNITITNGSANHGGGIYCKDSSPSLMDVTISNNTGSGIRCEDSSPNLMDVTISDNTGSGIRCNNSSPSLANVTVSGNSGGGISCSGNSNPSLENVTISDNNGRGISCSGNSNPSLENVTISDNNGSGIYCEYSSPSLVNVTVSGNSGGGIYCYNSSNPSLVNLIITDNTSYAGGGIYCWFNSSPSLVGVTITSNTASSGGGIYCENNSSPSLENVTISGNYASSRGGGIYCVDSSTLIFDAVNRCNIFLNFAGSGSDLYASNCPTIDVIVDTFTVLPPDYNLAFPYPSFTFDILNAKIEQVDQDLYVSPDGSDDNSGLTADDPLLTISYALAKVLPGSTNPHIIHLSNGTYSPSGTGERFPLNCRWYISLLGENEDSTILDGEELSNILFCECDNYFTIENMTIQNGNAYEGGGIYCYKSSPSIMDVTITGNSADENGGGICCDDYSSPTLTNVTITGNSANDGGGIYCEWYSPLSLENVTISDNNGVGIYCGGNSSPDLENVTISGNNGRGISCGYHSNPDLENVIVSDNNGIGIYGNGSYSMSLMNVIVSNNNGNGIFSRGHPNLDNVLVSDNSNYGIRFLNANPSLNNVTITGNNAGGVYCRSSNISVINSILYCDTAQEIYFSDGGNPNSITISYSDIQGGEAGIVTNNNGTVNWLEGNLDEDPLFVGTGDHPFSLLEDSPCIDAGIPDTTGLNLPSFDLIGNLRIWDGDGDGIAIIDMGAYEYGAPPYVDVDDNVIVQTPEVFLQQNYPNPFNPTTTINYSLKENSKVSLNIYNIKGQKVKTLVDETLESGNHTVIWNGKDDNNKSVSSGVYFYKLKTANFEKTKKMILMK